MNLKTTPTTTPWAASDSTACFLFHSLWSPLFSSTHSTRCVYSISLTTVREHAAVHRLIRLHATAWLERMTRALVKTVCIAIMLNRPFADPAGRLALTGDRGLHGLVGSVEQLLTYLPARFQWRCFLVGYLRQPGMGDAHRHTCSKYWDRLLSRQLISFAVKSVIWGRKSVVWCRNGHWNVTKQTDRHSVRIYYNPPPPKKKRRFGGKRTDERTLRRTNR